MMKKSIKSFPEPLRGMDTGSFAEYTVTKRLVEIGERTIHENSFSIQTTARLRSLIDDLPLGTIRLLQDEGAPDAEPWKTFVQPYVGQNWLEVPWFFCETYFYRRILEATGYYWDGEGQKLDPYTLQKRLGLEQNQEAIQRTCLTVEGWAEKAADNNETAGNLLESILALSLWGNQADLSMWPEDRQRRPSVQPTGGLQSKKRNLLVNDSRLVGSYLCQLDQPRIDFILDNSGLELVCDLLAADLLLRLKLAGQIVFHVKAHPTFVSDTIVSDIDWTIAFLLKAEDSLVRSAGERLRSLFRSGKIRIDDDFYWNSPLAFWDAPDTILHKLKGTELAISKGDANYRRFLGDRHWAKEVTGDEALGYLPFPFLALRVCKSELVIGLKPDQPELLTAIDRKWMVNGEWGMIQFVNAIQV